MTERKIRKRFLRQEKSRLKRRISSIREIVDDVLREEFGRRLYNLKHDDELRLLTLYSWQDRYKVNVRWMLKVLIPIWSKKFSRFKVRSALGCRVATLVGKKSEEIIRERIWRDFRNEENKANWRQNERDRINKLIGAGDRRRKRRKDKYSSIVEAPNPKEFIKAYKKGIKWQKKIKLTREQKRELKDIRNKPYRNNPFQN